MGQIGRISEERKEFKITNNSAFRQHSKTMETTFDIVT